MARTKKKYKPGAKRRAAEANDPLIMTIVKSNTERFVFFFQSKSVFSQHFPAQFTIDNQQFNCCEQYMMYKKATLFNDMETAQKILESKDPKQQKTLGRMVQNFDAETWEKNCQKIVYDANYAKFSQNPSLADSLLAEEFHGKTFVEASPYDKIWGIGMREDVARRTEPSKWPGKNWLGLELTKVRDELLKARPRATTATTTQNE